MMKFVLDDEYVLDIYAFIYTCHIYISIYIYIFIFIFRVSNAAQRYNAGSESPMYASLP